MVWYSRWNHSFHSIFGSFKLRSPENYLFIFLRLTKNGEQSIRCYKGIRGRPALLSCQENFEFIAWYEVELVNIT